MLTLPVDAQIQLRLPQESDAPLLFELVDRNRKFLRQFMPWVDFNTTPEDALTFIRECRKGFESGSGYSLCILYDGKIAGTIGFHYIDRLNEKTELGYWLSEDHQGKGIMRASCRAMVKYAFEKLDMHRVEIRCAVDNVSSQHIPEALGFVREGILRESIKLNGQFKDTLVYSLLKT